MKKKKSTVLTVCSGLAIGAVNGMFGAGGGLLAVPLLKKLGLTQKQAHANAIAVILPITVLSAALYLLRGYTTVGQAFVYLPGGLVGALVGTVLLKKLSPVWLKRIFGCFMVYAGVRLLLR